MNNRVAANWFTMLLAALVAGAAPFAVHAAGSVALPSAHTSRGDSNVTISVDGLTCATCSIAVRHALKKMDGIKSVEGGPHENEAVVTYDATKVKPEQMVEAIDRAGFKASLPAKD